MIASLFSILGDTAWELLHRLTLDETKEYLSIRAEQQFNVIQTVALAEFDDLKEPNRNGDLPLIDLDPECPNEAYFAHLDAVIQEANSLGLFVGLLPTWGEKWLKRGRKDRKSSTHKMLTYMENGSGSGIRMWKTSSG